MQYGLHFVDIASFISCLESSKDGTGSWKQYGEHHYSLDTNPGGTDCQQTLDAFCQQARYMDGLQETIQQIETLAGDLVLDLPRMPTIRRVKTWDRTRGSVIDPHRVLAGNTRPWRKTSQGQTVRTLRTVSMILPCSYPYFMTQDDIVWTVAASCAFAMLLNNSGVNLELVGASLTTDLHTNGCNNVTTIGLKTLGSSWDLHGLALLCQAAFFRRGIFRLMEMSTEKYGQLNSSYGCAPSNRDKYRTMLAQHTWPPSQGYLYVASYLDKITNHPTAKAWIHAQVKAFAAGETLL